MDRELFYRAVIGVLGGTGFFMGLMMITPFLGRVNIDFANLTLWAGTVLMMSGLIALTYSVLSFTEV